MDEYQHPLFFEAKDLTDREKDKLRRYFQKRRDSGGGDCTTVQTVGGNMHKIGFKEKEDQERVLQRKFHTITLPSGDRHLTVSRSDAPQTPDQPSTQTFTKANTKGLEKIFKIEVYLLYYLRDNPRANRVLRKQLSSIGCTVELNFDEEEAVVRGDIEKGPGGAFGAAEKWELQVDRVFIGLTETYLCFHVLNPKQQRMLLQDRSSVADDEMKVYRDTGYSVVVGEAEAVRERIANLEKSLPTCKELPIVGETFKLVEGEFSREMRAHHPGVQIQIRHNMIIVEGPDEEVQAGATKLDQLMNKVLVKTVQFPSDLMTFMRSSDAISKYHARFQHSLRHPVSVKVALNLILSSLSSDALDEAEAAVRRELGADTVKLQGAAAVPPDLDRVKDILTRAKNVANCRELRVDVSYIPGASVSAVSAVRLVGYSEDISKLKEVLQDYQMNQVGIQEVLMLPYPELVDRFDKVLGLIGLKQTEVSIKTSPLPHPRVLMSGPRCHVQEVQQALIAALSSLTSDILVLDGPGAQRYFQAEGKVSKDLVESSCQVLIAEHHGANSQDVNIRSRGTSSPGVTPLPSITGLASNTVENVAADKTILKITLGSLEDEQVNALVVPMLDKKLTSTVIGQCLLTKAGNTIQAKFDSVAATRTVCPGDVLQVAGPASLGCSKLFFIECLPWDGVRGQSVQALADGLKRCLDLCVQQRLVSVAFPLIGPGIALKFPPREAIGALAENIRQFGLSASSGCLSTIHVVVKPGYPDSEECYHDVYRHLSANMNQGDQVIFRPLTSDLDDITLTAGGGVRLRLVFGDITNETTDAVVNTTDFVHFQDDGVCKDILAVAGPEVTSEVQAATVKRGEVLKTRPGSFPCRALLHVCGQKDAGVTEKLVHRIVQLCNTSGYKSVAIPAICTGSGGLDPGVVAAAILRGVERATSSTPNSCLADIRLVLRKIDVFLEFREKAMQVFPTAAVNRVSVPHVQQTPRRPVAADLSILHSSSANQQSAFLFVGLQDIPDAMAKLKDLYQAQCSSQTFTTEQLEFLSQDDVESLKQVVEAEGLYVQSGPGGSTVSGLKDGVNRVMQMINASLQGGLRAQQRVREEEDLYTRVAWCILGNNGNWERLPKVANRKLENSDISGAIVDAQSYQWNVDLQRTEATRRSTGQKQKLKRLENLPDFTLPLYWDNMAAGESMKVVTLEPSSAEYHAVKEAFKRTAPKAVMKINRLQNVHLRRAYESQKKHISDKNVQGGGAGERLLYHGTTQENCDSIMTTGFNRRFAGQNATLYGLGTYFAVNAVYSAHPTYSKPNASGCQLMFVARVLTGLYTVGQGGMMVPPPRNTQRPHDLYDSVVDNTDDPNMYVVFHDDQAYPDYLITFK